MSILILTLFLGCTKNPLVPQYDEQGFIEMWKGKLTGVLYNNGITDDKHITSSSCIVSYVFSPDADITKLCATGASDEGCIKASAFSNVCYDDEDYTPLDVNRSEWFFQYIDSNSDGEPQFYYESPNTFYYFLTGIPDEGTRYKAYFAVYYDYKDWQKRPIAYKDSSGNIKPNFDGYLSPAIYFEIKLTSDGEKDVPGMIYFIPNFSRWAKAEK